jgi:CRP-like cAMP-binding protein
VIYAQGDCGDAVFYIQKGRVKLTVVSKFGKQAVIGVLGAGSFFGEGCLRGQPYTATATAMVKSSIERLEKSVVSRVLGENLAFSELFLVFRLSWKRRARSPVKITERTHEKGTTTSLSRAEGDHSAPASTGEGTDFGTVRGVWVTAHDFLPLAEGVV